MEIKEYKPREIESKWQRKWEEDRIFHVKEEGKKFYLLEMFPYPSGKIHMGHVRNYTIGDAIARYLFMKGYNVLHPMGWDAFGLPAENAAIKHGMHPALWTKNNIEHMKKQLKSLGFSYDWSREISTCEPSYYRWEQKIFIEMFKRGLAYKKKGIVNWCPECATVLANEQVEGGVCWRCGSPVTFRELEQWYFKITAYAEELLQGLKALKGKWPERVLIMQENWIGRSEGAECSFPLENGEGVITVFTTRLDTVYGATFMSLAPEHPLAIKLAEGTPYESAVKNFVEKTLRKRLVEKETTEKEGVWTGKYCINPFTGWKMPIYVANFVLMEYGTGAVMAVPAHDQRDFEFAKKYGLPIKVVVNPVGKSLKENELEKAFEEDGVLVNSGPFSGLPSAVAREKIAEFIKEKGWGRKVVNYKIKDWGISRQRYWGAPIPVVYCKECGIQPVKEEDLPVVLPENVKISGKGESPLKSVPEFVRTTCPECGGYAERETDTMDTFVESSWYFLRYASPQEDNAPFDKKKVKFWLPVDLYIGGIEHAVLHLLYARFFVKVLRDLGYIEFDEPFLSLLTQGMVIKEGRKMSKSFGNVVEPDEIIEKYGADTARLFILFASPPEKDLEWSDHGVEGCFRFINRTWRIFFNIINILKSSKGMEKAERHAILKLLHQTIKRITDEFNTRYHFNTAISGIMEFLNALTSFMEEKNGKFEPQDIFALKEVAYYLPVILSPFTPHVAEEMWSSLKEVDERAKEYEYVSRHPWPSYNPDLVVEEYVNIPVQVDGKLRGVIRVRKDEDEEEVFKMAVSDPKIQRHLSGRKILKKIYQKNKILNIVTGG
jgi:leucyl-tRNA synthetase